MLTPEQEVEGEGRGWVTCGLLEEIPQPRVSGARERGEGRHRTRGSLGGSERQDVSDGQWCEAAEKKTRLFVL